MKRFFPYLVLFLGVLTVSTASILIRLAQQLAVSSAMIAAGRLCLAALIISPIAWFRARNEIKKLPPRDLLGALAAGFFLALHFALWITSLEYTSVASSAALVATNPLWVSLGSFFFLREKINRSLGIGIFLTVGGSILISFSDTGSSAYGRMPLIGDGLALLGALAASSNLLLTRSLRSRLSLIAYIWLAYTSAALILLFWVILSGQPIFGHPPFGYLLLFALALGPQLLGHTAFNWALRYLSATFVAIAILGEPIGATILARWCFGEEFVPLQLAGFFCLMVGIYIAASSEREAPPLPA